jgi:hypothetical protein
MLIEKAYQFHSCAGEPEKDFNCAGTSTTQQDILIQLLAVSKKYNDHIPLSN